MTSWPDQTQRELAAYHEAGHAVAATMRSGGTFTSVTLGATHGTGVTRVQAEGVDNHFITWAGPWAEARFVWPEEDIADIDEHGRTFLEVVGMVLGLQEDDQRIVVAAKEQASAAMAHLDGGPQTWIDANYQGWSAELEVAWPAITWVAESLLDERTVTHVDARTAFEVARIAFGHWTP